MITIEIYRRPEKVNDEELIKITKELPRLVSEEFHPQFSHISGDDSIRESRVKVLINDFGPRDTNTEDLEISIKVGFPEPLRCCDEERKNISKGVKEILNNKVIPVRKKFPSFITFGIEVDSICSSSEVNQSSE